MKQIHSINRDQIQMRSLDMMVSEQSTVRLLDVFLDWADSKDLGFKSTKRFTGRPSFPTRTLLGIYIYGYLHRIRSSRALEKACQVNIELMWLVKGQKPCYKTISNFRKDNGKGFKNLFALYRDFLCQLELFGKETIAIDGSKFRAQNSMKNNYNAKKVERHLEYIESKEQEYLDSLDQSDKESAMDNPNSDQRLGQLAERKLKYEDLKQQLQDSNQTQISTTDPDARALPLHMRIVEVGYNLQSAVDAKHNLIVDYEVINKNDHRALAPMALKAKSSLGLEKSDTLTVLADKGYHTGEQMQQCHDANIETIVAIPRKSKHIDKTKPQHLQKENFTYNLENDTYMCPNGKTLTKQATYKRKDRLGISSMKFDRYTIKHSICIQCPHYKECVSIGKQKASQGRCIDRYHTDGAVQRNKTNVANNKELYKRRQAIVEHLFGTIKRQWGYTHTLMKTIPKVDTEFSIIMLCYNLRRSISILGLKRLKMAIRWANAIILNIRATIMHLVRRLILIQCDAVWEATENVVNLKR